MHSLPMRTTGHVFLHSCLHFFGLHLSSLTMAMRVSSSALWCKVSSEQVCVSLIADVCAVAKNLFYFILITFSCTAGQWKRNKV